MKKYLSLFLFCLACTQPTKESIQSSTADLNPKLATRFTVNSVGEDIILSIDKPWQGSDQSIHYYLYKDSIIDRTGFEHHTFIKVPIRSMASNSTTHLGLMEVLGVNELLSGFAQTKFIYSKDLSDRVDAGQVVEIGMERGINMESVLALDPDILMAFSSGSENPQLKQLQQLGVPVVMNADYLETTVLGRAEWIKFLGYFVGKSSEANQYFDQLVVNYDSLKKVVRGAKKPNVLSGTIYGSSWFMPGGNNYNSQMIADGGGNYLWKDNPESGWHSLDFEAVYERGWNADYWIGAASFRDLAEMKMADPRYADFECFKMGEVYTYNNRMNEAGGSDYFESGNVHPDRLLADHIKILHPDLLPDYQLYYYRKLD